jgi:hypothetical protein
MRSSVFSVSSVAKPACSGEPGICTSYIYRTD